MALVQRTITGTIKNAAGSAVPHQWVYFTPTGLFGASGVVIPTATIKVATDANGLFSVQLYTVDTVDAFVRYAVIVPDSYSGAQPSEDKFYIDVEDGSATTLDALLNLGSLGNANLTAMLAALQDIVDGNLNPNNVGALLESTVTSGTINVLTAASKGVQRFTGSVAQLVRLPVVSTLPHTGFQFVIINNSSEAISVIASGGSLIVEILPNEWAILKCVQLTGVDSASWTTIRLFAFNVLDDYLTATSALNLNLTNADGVFIRTDGSGASTGNEDAHIDVDTNTGTIRLVSTNLELNGLAVTIGANDSGGSGFRALVVPNV